MQETIPTFNWVITTETPRSPMVSVGGSSDRIFSPEGTRSWYFTFAKSIPGAPVAPYFSLSWSEWEDRLLVPFGANIAISPSWDFLAMNDGRNSHLLLTSKQKGWSVSGMLIKMKHPGVSWTWRF